MLEKITSHQEQDGALRIDVDEQNMYHNTRRTKAHQEPYEKNKNHSSNPAGGC